MERDVLLSTRRPRLVFHLDARACASVSRCFDGYRAKPRCDVFLVTRADQVAEIKHAGKWHDFCVASIAVREHVTDGYRGIWACRSGLSRMMNRSALAERFCCTSLGDPESGGNQGFSVQPLLRLGADLRDVALAAC